MSQNSLSTNRAGIFPTGYGELLFIAGVPAIAIVSGIFVSHFPKYFLLVLMLNLWLLGYHHVISTYTRIASNIESIKQHWILLLPLPLLVFFSVYVLYQSGGAIVLGSLYLYWQWYHYTRQSEGIAKSYGLKCHDPSFSRTSENRILFYQVPLTSFIYMLSRGQNDFLGIPIFSLELPEQSRYMLLLLSCSGSLIWLLLSVKALSQNRISVMYFCYLLSHRSIPRILLYWLIRKWLL